ncbi:PREDICTED: matrin-3-like [Cyprinodon variegatus]|uniref:Matrin-3-like n=1 Tax=Cyprinodon variegatus TaxID=28743 RepID=A0A3Q2DSI3_CYPVA|nr:PREDICTED: matrin-3-like [Cyprinodon variegatus]XP_015226993.1 PREDICTED: matrin-3-like [Cyprinodon variegatus]
MAQQSQSDGSQTAFSVSRGLNFNMNEQGPSRSMGGGSSGLGMGGMESPDGGGHLGRHMKLFSSLGLSPSDLDALAELPDEDISMETLPRILMQLKSRKVGGGDRGAASSSSEAAFRGGRDSWDPSLGQGLSRVHSSGDFGFSSMRDSYSSGYSMGPSSDPMFMSRRMGTPSSGKIQDFLGVIPPMFPHVCSLCDFDVHSTMEWDQHLNGLRHAENRRRLLDMYPDWEPGRRETPNLSAGLLGPAPMSTGPIGGMSSSWGGRGRSENMMGPNVSRSRVVVVKYERKPLSNKTLFAFTETFGRLREHLILNNKAFLEMDTHEAALSMVNYYQQHPTKLYGKPVTFYLSKRLMAIEKSHRSSDLPMEKPNRDVTGQGSKVVFFANLPKDDEKKKELLTISRRFGTVDKHLFLTDQAFVQLGTVEDAEMLVKYYSMNPLIIKGRLIRLNICTKYKTLNVSHRQGEKDTQSRRSSRSETSRTSKSSSKGREERKKRDDNDDKEKPAGEGEDKEEEPEEKQGGQREGLTSEDSEDEEQPERSESAKEEDDDQREEKNKEEDSGDDDAAEDGATKEAESEDKTGPGGPTDESEKKENVDADESNEAAEGDEPEEEFDQSFLENMEDFVTLDELEDDEGDASIDSSGIDNTRRGGMRVINILGFRRGYNFLNDILALAKPFGKVVKHLVLDLRPEAYIQFEKEDEAIAMAKFYNGNVTPMVCGRAVRVTHSLSYPTIQCGSSRVIYIGQIPNVNYSDQDILKLAEPYGKIQKYFLHRLRRECFIEMEKAESAEKMAEACKGKQLKFQGKRLTIYVSRKYKQLKHGHRYPITIKREASRSPERPSKTAEEPPAKKQKPEAESEEDEVKAEEEEDEGEVEQKEDEATAKDSCDITEDEKMKKQPAEKLPEDSEEMSLSKEEKDEEMDTSTNQNGQTEALPPADEAPSVAGSSVATLPPYDPDTPIGVEHVKMGYYCRICFLFYSNEDKAKKVHCSSQAHYDKLQKHLEKQQAKAQKMKTTMA